MDCMTVEDIARLLRAITLEARQLTGRKYPNPVDMNSNNTLKLMYGEAVDDLRLFHGTSLTVESWFSRHWHVFPFASDWDSLNMVEQRFVTYAHKLCQEMTIVRN